MELSAKVRQLGKERDYLEKELNTSQVCNMSLLRLMHKTQISILNERINFKTFHNLTFQLEKLRVCRERDDILDNQSLRYEERLVELHSVIAELSRQLEQKSRERITEEDDDDTADADNDADTTCENNSDIFQEASGKHNGTKTVLDSQTGNKLASSKSDVLSRTSTDVIDAEAVEV